MGNREREKSCHYNKIWLNSSTTPSCKWTNISLKQFQPKLNILAFMKGGLLQDCVVYSISFSYV